MANIGSASPPENYTIDNDKLISCSVPTHLNVNPSLDYDKQHKNHNQLPNGHTHYTDNHKDNEGKFTLLHQNIQGIANKTNELLISLSPNPPQIICLTEHHLQKEQINNIRLDQYTLGAAFCRKIHKNGGVCIYVHKNLQYNTININQYTKEDFETCALRIYTSSNTFTVICIYRSPTGNFQYF